MNFALFGYLISLLAIVYSVFVIYITCLTALDVYKTFGFLPAEINLNKEIFLLVISIAYIATYHLS